MNRRALFGAAAGIAAAPILVAMPQPAYSRQAGPPTVTPDQLRFKPRVLRKGGPAKAGLVAEHVEKIVPDTAEFMKPGADGKPSHPGFVVLAARDGVIVTHEAGGHALRYKSYDAETDTATELPKGEQVPMAVDSIFDVASMTKLFTSMVATQMAEAKELDLDAKVSKYLPEFAASDPEKKPITVKFLLRHVSGLKSWLPLHAEPDNAARLRLIYESELQYKPGTDYEYSDMNLITLAAIIEKLTGSTLDVEVAKRITKPLGLRDTGFNPPKSKLNRIAATEYQPDLDRGMIRGRVHDENAWSFGGVAGHAGIFSTAHDIAVFAQTILNGGTYKGTRLLSEKWVRALLTEYNTEFPPEAGRGLGWQLDQRFFMDAMASPVTAGHTGFTGTCVVMDPIARSVYVLLTNRVHPTRNWGTESAYRRAAARDLSRAVPVEPRRGKAWFAVKTPASLSASFDTVNEAKLRFSLWYDTEPDATVTLQVQTDNGKWAAVDMELSTRKYEWTSEGTVTGFVGRQWIDVLAKLPDKATAVRVLYRGGEGTSPGRGVYIDEVIVTRQGGTIFDGEQPADAKRFKAKGFAPSKD